MNMRHRHIAEGKKKSCLIFARHEPVFTAGMSTRPRDVKSFASNIIKVDRGGKIVYHEPGQLICYPILNLVDFNITRSDYVPFLYNWILSTLTKLNFKPFEHDQSSIWIYNSQNIPIKVGFIGVGIYKNITKHGFAINLNTNLDIFKTFPVCSMGYTNTIGNMNLHHHDLAKALSNNFQLNYNIYCEQRYKI